MLDNILASKLYRPGSVAYVSRSGGMSNELNNIIALNTDGVFEVKMIVMLGEVGGVEEYKLIKAMGDGRVNKPVVAWCIGTCAKMFTSEVQFGHAGACANADTETAEVKNKALTDAGAYVPRSFDELGHLIKEVYEKLVNDGTIVPRPEEAPPTVPMDYAWARANRVAASVTGIGHSLRQSVNIRPYGDTRQPVFARWHWSMPDHLASVIRSLSGDNTGHDMTGTSPGTLITDLRLCIDRHLTSRSGHDMTGRS
ncbi:hypothetical protein DPMN_191345 [Dreissena polymorpha]|uniref:ATP citrate synthase n=1 Tax=Dreissena polymorpha TaxID=45954 RepID=A0A9D3XZ28_DREPO|nr:hypothetical protein DPMN_191345 [Dreissena polymorpha]